LSKKLAKQGSKLVLIDIDTAANEKTAEEITEASGQAFTYTCDLSNREDIYRVADKVKSRFVVVFILFLWIFFILIQTKKKIKEEIGNISILVNNAGIVTGKKFLDSPDPLILKTFQVNTTAHFWLAKGLFCRIYTNS